MSQKAYVFSGPLLPIWTSAVVFFLIAPLVVVTLVSFSPFDYLSLPTTDFSLKWYRRLAEHPEFMSGALHSILLATEAACTAVVLGTLTALAIVRYRFPFREMVRGIATAPLIVPMVMTGLAILMMFSSLNWFDQHFRLYAGHAILTLPYVVRTVSASLTGFDMNQELAARNLGASPFAAFMRITLPQITSGVFAGGVFAFIVSFDNVGLSIFLVGAQFNILPVELFSYASYSNDPMAAAVSVLMILFSVVAIALLEYCFGLRRLMA